MLNAKQILVSTIVLAASVSNLSACGQTGALYLPEKKAATTVQPSTPTTANSASQ